MSLTELLPTVQALSHADKLRLMHLLVAELAREENVSLLPDSVTCPIWTPYEAFDGAAVLLGMLKEPTAL